MAEKLISGVISFQEQLKPVRVRMPDACYWPALEHRRKRGKRSELVKVSYIYSSFTGWVRADRVEPR